MNCRFCNSRLQYEFIDLGNAPPSNSFLIKEQLNEPEIFYPLKLFLCDNCFLVQIDEYKKSNEIFSDNYAYFSSFSQTWLDHAKRYVSMITERLNLTGASQVIEIASNDGYLLQYFLEKNIPCLGIEPSKSVAEAAHRKGIEVITDFFSPALAADLAAQGKKADLLIGNNVLAHVPNINEFVRGLKIALKPQGVITMEFPHLMRLIEQNQFDTIYHEHFSYFSFHTVKTIFQAHGLSIFDVEELNTHGGSLRIYAKHIEDLTKEEQLNVKRLLYIELSARMTDIEYYQGFQLRVNAWKYKLLSFLIAQKEAGKSIAAYGAAAKGNTLLNYCGIKKDLIDFVADASPHKQGKFLPGSHIPVVHEIKITEQQPDIIIIFPWNIKQEIITQLSYIREWSGRFLTAMPKLEIY